MGQKVKVELDWNQDLGVSYEGTVEMISALGETGEAGAAYPVYVSFTPDGDTRYGMSALVTTLEEESPETAAETGDNPEPAENGDEQNGLQPLQNGFETDAGDRGQSDQERQKIDKRRRGPREVSAGRRLGGHRFARRDRRGAETPDRGQTGSQTEKNQEVFMDLR